MTKTKSDTVAVVVALALDIFSVLLFVAVGRRLAFKIIR